MSLRTQSALTGLLIVVMCHPIAVAQRVFHSSRSAGPLGGRTTGTFSFSVGGGSRWGNPGTSGFGSSNRPSSSPKWNLRPTYNSSRSVTPRYDAASSSRGRSLSYSSIPRSSRAYSVYGGPIQYRRGHNHGHLHPYDQTRVLNGLPLQYSYSRNFVAPPAIIAPPIVIPYGGPGSSFLPPGLPTAPLSSNVQPSLATTQQAPLPVPATLNSATPAQQSPADETPIVNEFGGPTVDTQKTVVAADRIRSLRYQTSGDNAFRKQDYPSATVFYRTAAVTAPSRRASWIRLAWAQIAQQEFAEAVVSFKTALSVEDDPSDSWIAGRNLYGHQLIGDQHSDQVWEWLQQRPNSTDRLLLVAGFQQMRGYSGIARELLEAAAATGLNSATANALRNIATQQALQQTDRAKTETSDHLPSESTDIRMRGRELLPADDSAESNAEPLAIPGSTQPPEEIPPPQEVKNIPLVPEVNSVYPMSLKIPADK